MKKIVTICLLLATAFPVKAQTKEETISWLKEKLEKYLHSKYNVVDESARMIKSININECTINLIIKYESTGDEFEEVLPTNGLIINDDNFSHQNEMLIFRDITHKGEIKYYKVFTNIYLVEGEPDLRTRVKKALDHLATFCPKKKEIF